MKYVFGFLLAVIAVTIAFACAFPGPIAVFSYDRHPDFPRTPFANGKLGVIQPGYARSYLVIAYRYVNGLPLNAHEQQQVKEYWKDRDTGYWDKTTTDWFDHWQKARLRVPGTKPLAQDGVQQNRFAFDPSANSFFRNCADDAFRTAAETLQDRISRFGLRSAAVKSWLEAQEVVFANCVAGVHKVPDAAAAELPAMIRSDRDYQIAAAFMYSGDHKQAETRFRQIAADPRSPWQWIAPYLVVRAMVRATNSDPANQSPEAEKEARRVMANKALVRIHGMTSVLYYRELRKGSDPEYFRYLGASLAGGVRYRSLREQLWDYTTIFDRICHYDPWKRVCEPDAAGRAVIRAHDLSDWIYTFQTNEPKSYDHALARWQKTGSRAWLLAALRHATVESPQVESLLAAVAETKPGDPAFESLAFHRLALMADAGRYAEARSELDSILSLNLSKSSANLFRGIRMRAAPDLNAFLSFAARKPVLLTNTENDGEVPLMSRGYADWVGQLTAPATGKLLLDLDSIKVLNERTPMRVLSKVAVNDAVPDYHKRDFVLAAFTRAILLNDDENATPLAERLQSIKADPGGYLKTYLQETDAKKRRFAALFYLLQHPEARPYMAWGYGRVSNPGRIDSFRDNWWCPVDIEVELGARSNTWLERQNPDSPRWRSEFLSDADRQQAAAELKRLAATRSAADLFLAETMTRAKANPKDPRVPESLYRALRVQRYGCVTAQTATTATAAWRLLGTRYPKNPWAQRASRFSIEGENLPKPYREP